MKSLHWGPPYTNAEIKRVFENCKAAYRWFDPENKQIDEMLQLLLAGKIVAWFQGAAEFGLRALGHRSLFASNLGGVCAGKPERPPADGS